MQTHQPTLHGNQPPSVAEEDDDYAAAAPGLLVRACTGVLMVAGLFTALTGLQLMLSRLIDVEVQVMKWALLLLGIGTIAVGWQASRARMWAAAGGLGLAIALTLVNLGWAIFGLVHGLISLMSIVSVPTAIAAAVAMVFTLGPVRRASRARARLRAQGLDVGI